MCRDTESPSKSKGGSKAKERVIESHLVKRVGALGGFAFKLPAHQYRYVPDRLVIIPGRVIFVELKRPKGGTTSRGQSWMAKRIKELGAEHVIWSTKDEIDEGLRS